MGKILFNMAATIVVCGVILTLTVLLFPYVALAAVLTFVAYIAKNASTSDN